MFDVVITIFNTFFFAPIVNLLIFITKLLESASVPGALGFSIIILTILIRLLLWPMMHSQIKTTQKMASLKPMLDALKKKHKDDKIALQTAQLALYKEHGVNPAGGCLPALMQLPVFIALYQAVSNVLPGVSGQNVSQGLEKVNALLYHPWLHLSAPSDPYFLGFNLAAKPTDFSSFGSVLLTIPVITVILTFIQSKMMIPAKPISHHPDESKKEIKEKESMEQTMAQVQSQMVYFMPFMVGYFAFTFPVGLAIYWNTFTILGIIQQYQIAGWGGMSDIFEKLGIVSKGKK